MHTSATKIIVGVTALLVIGAVRSKPAASDKIIGGSNVIKGAHPYQVHILRTRPNGQIISGCGGTIIHYRYVLTAAHCVNGISSSTGLTTFPPENLVVRVGQHDRTLMESHAKNYNVWRIISHPSFNLLTYANDIALLEVDPIIFTDYVKPICIHDGKSAEIPTSQWLTVTGWGTTSYGVSASSSNVLQSAQLKMVNLATCRGWPWSNYFWKVKEGMVCAAAAGKDSCHGDSGGPLTISNLLREDLVGIVSFGNGCADPNYPGVYTDANYYVSWIEQNTGLDFFPWVCDDTNNCYVHPCPWIRG